MRYLLSLGKIIENNPLLSVIVFIGFLLRFISVKPGYYYPHGDELLYSQALYMIINKTLSFQTQYFGFPPFIPWIMIPFFVIFFIPASWFFALIKNWDKVYLLFSLVSVFIFTVAFFLRKRINLLKTIFILFWTLLIISGVAFISQSSIFHNDILGKNWIGALYWGRYLTVLFGTSAIVLTYLTALEFFNNKRVAILSSLFVSVNYRLVINSHVGLPDMYNVFFLMLSMYLISRLSKKPTFRNYIIAWVSVASTFLIKYQVHILIPLFLTHLVISFRESRSNVRKFLKSFFSKKVIIGGLISILIVLVSHIYHFINWAKVVEINNYEAIKYGFGRNIFDMYVIAYLYNVAIGPFLSITAVLGIVFGFLFKKYRVASTVLISVLPTFMYLYLYYTGGGFYTRNLISAIPILLIFSAVFLESLFTSIEKVFSSNITTKVFLIIILVVGIFSQFKDSVIAAYEYSRVSPREKVQSWLDENLKEKIIFGRYMGNPIPHDDNVVLKNLLPFSQAFSYRELLDEGIDKAILEMTWIRAENLWWTRKKPEIQIKFWNKPNDLLSQTYYALAFRELLYSHGLGLFITPWQATTHHFAVVDLRKENKFVKLKEISNIVDFSHDWAALSYLDKDKILLKKDTKLTILNGEALPGGIRFQFKPFAIDEKYGYLIKAKIKIDKDTQKDDRQSFIRLDFYDDNFEHNNGFEENILSRPNISFVSKRVFGKSDIYDVYIQAIAPVGSKFATVGFQGSSVNSSFTLESVSIFKTEEVVSDNSPKLIISDDDLFLPNDEGIL